MEKKTFISRNADQTRALAREVLVSFAGRGREKALVLALEGELGGGKTTFVQGLAEFLNLDAPVTSPTFVIMKRYKINNPEVEKTFKNLFHADCYRLENENELSVLGFLEIVKKPENLVIVEWAEKVKKAIPGDAVWIKFEWLGEEERKIEIKNKDGK